MTKQPIQFHRIWQCCRHVISARCYDRRGEYLQPTGAQIGLLQCGSFDRKNCSANARRPYWSPDALGEPSHNILYTMRGAVSCCALYNTLQLTPPKLDVTCDIEARSWSQHIVLYYASGRCRRADNRLSIIMDCMEEMRWRFYSHVVTMYNISRYFFRR